jgi:hypothetical protein
MSYENAPADRERASELAREFVENDLLPDAVEDDVIEHLDREEPMRALRTIIRHRTE